MDRRTGRQADRQTNRQAHKQIYCPSRILHLNWEMLSQPKSASGSSLFQRLAWPCKQKKQTNAEILLPWTEKLLPRPLFGWDTKIPLQLILILTLIYACRTTLGWSSRCIGMIILAVGWSSRIILVTDPKWRNWAWVHFFLVSPKERMTLGWRHLVSVFLFFFLRPAPE